MPIQRLKNGVVASIVAMMLLSPPSIVQAEFISKGSARCGQWLEARTKNQALSYEFWLLGFLSGLAAGEDSNVLQSSDPASLEFWMDNFCRADPLSNVATGGTKLYI